MLKSLDHPSCIKLYETFEDDQNVFLVTEYAAQESVCATAGSCLTAWTRTATSQSKTRGSCSGK